MIEEKSDPVSTRLTGSLRASKSELVVLVSVVFGLLVFAAVVRSLGILRIVLRVILRTVLRILALVVLVVFAVIVLVVVHSLIAPFRFLVWTEKPRLCKKSKRLFFQKMRSTIPFDQRR